MNAKNISTDMFDHYSRNKIMTREEKESYIKHSIITYIGEDAINNKYVVNTYLREGKDKAYVYYAHLTKTKKDIVNIINHRIVHSINLKNEQNGEISRFLIDHNKDNRWAVSSELYYNIHKFDKEKNSSLVNYEDLKKYIIDNWDLLNKLYDFSYNWKYRDIKKNGLDNYLQEYKKLFEIINKIIISVIGIKGKVSFKNKDDTSFELNIKIK